MTALPPPPEGFGPWIPNPRKQPVADDVMVAFYPSKLEPNRAASWNWGYSNNRDYYSVALPTPINHQGGNMPPGVYQRVSDLPEQTLLEALDVFFQIWDKGLSPVGEVTNNLRAAYQREKDKS